MQRFDTAYTHSEPTSRDLLPKLCDRHGLDYTKVSSGVAKVEHCFGQKLIKGKERDVIFVRSRGSASQHVVSMGDDGIFYCSCPAWLHKGGRDTMKPCKHLLYVLVCGLASAECRLQYYV